MSVGQIIKFYRKEKGFTQSDLAEIIGVSIQAVSKWETDAGMPDVSQIVPLAKALNVSTDTILGFSNDKELEDIIMEKDQELEELRKYKEDKECAERDFEVQKTLEELRECVDKETLEALKEEGLACKLSDIDGWKNKAKALAFDKNATKKEFTSVWSMAISGQTTKQATSMWDNVN